MDESMYRKIPSVDKLLGMPVVEAACCDLPRKWIVNCIRDTLTEIRRRVAAGEGIELSAEAMAESAVKRARKLAAPSLRRVVNATGLVLHTNLGRAPLSERAIQQVSSVMSGYSTLEYDLAMGARGSRYEHVIDRICRLTGAEDAIVVNNNAGAVLLVLASLAAGKEVIVSRGQLVEVGGSFRIPDVMRQSGVKLVEVGATNKTRISDYQNAISSETSAIMKVHTSNYRIVGFFEQPSDGDLKQLAVERNILLVDDLGSGTLLPLELGGVKEPSVAERIAAGMDIVTFSGDKLLGGSQAGIIAGKKECIARISKHPLLRALRVDKLTLAALEGTLIDYEVGNPLHDVPTVRLLMRPVEEVQAQAEELAHKMMALRSRGWYAKAAPTIAQSGGGAFPAVDIPSYGVRLTVEGKSASAIEQALRMRDVPIICRLQDDAVYFDVRCLSAHEQALIVEACLAIAGADS